MQLRLHRRIYILYLLQCQLQPKNNNAKAKYSLSVHLRPKNNQNIMKKTSSPGPKAFLLPSSKASLSCTFSLFRVLNTLWQNAKLIFTVKVTSSLLCKLLGGLPTSIVFSFAERQKLPTYFQNYYQKLETNSVRKREHRPRGVLSLRN